MRTFRIVWLGQLLSLFGSGLTAFAVGVWVYQQTGSMTRFALVLFAGSIPGVLLLPVAGLLADRWDRRLTMILSDAGAGLGALALAAMFYSGHIAIGWIYILLIFSSSLATFQRPAYSAAVAQFVRQQDLTRANGMVRTAQAVAQLFAPLLGGVLLSFLHIGTIVLLDAGSFGIALVSLLAVRFPPIPAADGSAAAAPGTWLQEMGQGWSYLTAHGGLLGLMVFFAAINLSAGFANALIQPLILSFASPGTLGTVLTAAGIGLLIGSLLMGVWGGPKRRIHGIFGSLPLAGCGLIVAGLRPSIPLVTAGLFLAFFALPFMEGSTSAIVQSKVEPKVLGRVFAVTHVIAGCMAPVSYVLAGPLVDRIFEPAMAPGGWLAGTIGPLIGVGKGRGMGLMLMVVGAAVLLTTAVGFATPRLRRVEDDLPNAEPAAATVVGLPVDGLELT